MIASLEVLPLLRQDLLQAPLELSDALSAFGGVPASLLLLPEKNKHIRGDKPTDKSDVGGKGRFIYCSIRSFGCWLLVYNTLFHALLFMVLVLCSITIMGFGLALTLDFCRADEVTTINTANTITVETIHRSSPPCQPTVLDDNHVSTVWTRVKLMRHCMRKALIQHY